MLIPSFCCATNSFFHSENKNSYKKITDHYPLIVTAWVIDAICGAALAILGWLALTSFAPHALTALPLAAKAALIGSGLLLIIIDAVYIHYRLNNPQQGVKKTLQRLKKEVEEIQDTAELRLAEEGMYLTEGIKIVEESITKMGVALKTINSDIAYIQERVNYENQYTSSKGLWNKKLDEGLKLKRNLQAQLLQHQAFLEELQANSIECQLSKEEVTSSCRDLLHKLHVLVRSSN